MGKDIWRMKKAILSDKGGSENFFMASFKTIRQGKIRVSMSHPAKEKL
jgi:hypothetical protein